MIKVETKGDLLPIWKRDFVRLDIMYPIQVAFVWGFGRKVARILFRLGATNRSDLRRICPAPLQGLP